MNLNRKYGIATTFLLPVIKAGGSDFAVSADWTPAAGDVKVSKDDAPFANITTLPTAIGNMWLVSLSATEMQAARVVVQIVDSATKAVEDQAVILETYGNAGAQHGFDLGAATVTLAATTHTGAVIPNVTTVDTTTTNTDMRGTDSAFLAASAPANFADLSITAGAGLVDVTQAAADKVWNASSRSLTDKVDFALSTAEHAVLVDGIWDEATSGHGTAGSTGKALTDAGSAGDPWSTTLPGAYGAGTAGKIVGDNLNATVGSRLATNGYVAPDNAGIAAILVDTADMQPKLGTPVISLAADIATVDVIADAVKAVTDKFGFDGSNNALVAVNAVNGNTAADALADAVGNRAMTIAGGTLTVQTKAGGTLYTKTVATDAAADHVTGLG
ncbi:MAG: hypothetical protein ACE5FN_08400 [Leptospirillia bacterium]